MNRLGVGETKRELARGHAFDRRNNSPFPHAPKYCDPFPSAKRGQGADSSKWVQPSPDRQSTSAPDQPYRDSFGSNCNTPPSLRPSIAMPTSQSTYSTLAPAKPSKTLTTLSASDYGYKVIAKLDVPKLLHHLVHKSSRLNPSY